MLLSGASIHEQLWVTGQQRIPTIGLLRARQPPKPCVDAFQQGLRELGFISGENVAIELRFTDGSVDQLPQLAEDLVRLRFAAILASAAPAALAAKKATTL